MYYIRFDLASAFLMKPPVLTIRFLGLIGWEGEIRIFENCISYIDSRGMKKKCIPKIQRYNMLEKFGVVHIPCSEILIVVFRQQHNLIKNANDFQNFLAYIYIYMRNSRQSDFIFDLCHRFFKFYPFVSLLYWFSSIRTCFLKISFGMV